jgi:uncharacterized membrane protein
MKFQLERIALFSDAVFAIAITLMMIEIKPPHLEHGIAFMAALQVFLNMFPIFVGTILSFCIVGIFWKKHHELMKYMNGYNSKVLTMNAALLLSIAFIPFSTAFVFENITAHSPLPLLIYNINYIIATLLTLRLFNYVLDPANNLRSELAPDDITPLKRELTYSIFVYVFVIVIAFINPDFAGMGYAIFMFEDRWTNAKRAVKVKTSVPES